MKSAKCILAAVVLLSMVFPVQGFSATFRRWEQVLSSSDTINIYVKNIVNASADSTVNADTITGIVKSVFAKRTSPKFNVVGSKSQANIVFSGKIVEYLWKKKAPITAIYSPAALAIDLATRGKKNYAIMQIHYKITVAATGKTLLNQITKVTLKKRNMPQEKTYEMIYNRAPRILDLDLFKRPQDE